MDIYYKFCILELFLKSLFENKKVCLQTVASNMEIKCKCHGMSGSCELKTCWRAVPDLRVVGNILKNKFKSATLVDQTNLGKTSRQLNT